MSVSLLFAGRRSLDPSCFAPRWYVSLVVKVMKYSKYFKFFTSSTSWCML
jgi:hypothetical protein